MIASKARELLARAGKEVGQGYKGEYSLRSVRGYEREHEEHEAPDLYIMLFEMALGLRPGTVLGLDSEQDARALQRENVRTEIKEFQIARRKDLAATLGVIREVPPEAVAELEILYWRLMARRGIQPDHARVVVRWVGYAIRLSEHAENPKKAKEFREALKSVFRSTEDLSETEMARLISSLGAAALVLTRESIPVGEGESKGEE